MALDVGKDEHRTLIAGKLSDTRTEKAMEGSIVLELLLHTLTDPIQRRWPGPAWMVSRIRAPALPLQRRERVIGKRPSLPYFHRYVPRPLDPFHQATEFHLV